MIKRRNDLMAIRVILWFFCLFIQPTQVNAAWVAELYGGNGLTEKHNAHVNLPDAHITATHEALKFDSAATIGGRGIYWVDRFSYLGLGLDAAHYFGPDQRAQSSLTHLCVDGSSCSSSLEKLKKFNNNITMVGIDVMLRYPLLMSEQFTQGQLQPYVTVGPALFISTLKDTSNFIPARQSSTSTLLGVKAGAGLTLLLTKHIGSFIEYRNSYFEAKDQYYNATVVHDLTLGKTLGNAMFNIQAIIGGVFVYF